MDQEKKKEKYEKPVLRTIELVAEEVMALGCLKSSSGNNARITGTCMIGTCSRVSLS